jgi:hypothetical protein
LDLVCLYEDNLEVASYTNDASWDETDAEDTERVQYSNHQDQNKHSILALLPSDVALLGNPSAQQSSDYNVFS